MAARKKASRKKKVVRKKKAVRKKPAAKKVRKNEPAAEAGES